MLTYDLFPAVTIRGQRVGTLKEASYLVRQYAIDNGDLAGWRLTRLLRNVECFLDGEFAEWALRIWIDEREQSAQTNIDIYADAMAGNR